MTLLAGSLADLDLASLADVTSLGRSSLRLEVTGPDGVMVGYLVLKAGRVVSATAGSLHGHNALHVLMNAAQNARFRLLREPLDFVMSTALASVDELPEMGRGRRARASSAPPSQAPPSQSQAHAVPEPRPRRDSASVAAAGRSAGDATKQGIFRRPARTSSAMNVPSAPRPPLLAQGTGARIRMMEGRLDEFDLATLLQVIGLGRSCIELEVLSEAGAQVGSVWVKSGKIVSARAGNIEGIAAISQLMHSRDGFQFAAFRVDADLDSTAALADVAQIVFPSASPASACAVASIPPSAPSRAATWTVFPAART
ncbi:MAG TPA: DUF4388 domain-containing protein, partial [Kofleriaceae bacterium]|nr:DUF4388 domain-containing protein [Kofleriaceae bacterium]